MTAADGLYRAAAICAQLARESDERITSTPAAANRDRRAQSRAYRVAERRITVEAMAARIGGSHG